MNVLCVVGFVAFFAFGVWLLYLERDLIRLGLASYKWASTEGTIISSHDDSFTIAGIDRTGTGIGPVRYDQMAYTYVYQVNGHTYQCSTFCFGGWSKKMSAAFLPGTKVPVYFDPEHPEVAVLRPGLQFGAIFGVVPIGAAFLWLFVYWSS